MRSGDLTSFGVWGGGGRRGISEMVVMWFGEGVDGVVGEGERGWKIGRCIVPGMRISILHSNWSWR